MTELPVTTTAAGGQRRKRPSALPRDDFDALYIEEMRGVTVHLIYRGATPYEAADAAHEAFIELLPDRWRTIEYPAAYLRKVAWTKYLRQQHHLESPRDSVPDRPGGTCPIAEVFLTDTQQRIVSAIQQLSPAQREVLAWQFDEFEYCEIAEFTGKTEMALRTNAKRGRAMLKKILLVEGVGRNEGGASGE
ncbi:RNA polymerase sigma factor [Streptomyces sp. NPDC057592]|uniref:RNA polymerase sigma factor n=1 Tax=unclassified Streptomyces TaxID=2593676 RepID=UPI0036CD36A1